MIGKTVSERKPERLLSTEDGRYQAFWRTIDPRDGASWGVLGQRIQACAETGCSLSFRCDIESGIYAYDETSIGKCCQI